MGLDMYAARRLDVKQRDHQSPEERYTVQIARGGKPISGVESDRISAVEEEVMCWHKANHIHAWFVDNVQDGQDDCRSYFVSWDKLRDLLYCCERVTEASKLVVGAVTQGKRWNSKHQTWDTMWALGKVIEDSEFAEEFLPTMEGCFFGRQEYDEHYLKDVVATQQWLERMLADHEAGVPGEIYYSATW